MSSVALSSCDLSKEGPSALSIRANATVKSGTEHLSTIYKYVLVDLNSKSLAIFGKSESDSLYGTFGSRQSTPASIILGVGDVVQLTIFEAQSGGLFIPAEAGARPGNYVTLPAQQIDASGNVTVPYAGSTRFAGKTIANVQSELVNKLKNRAIEPQVVITLQSQRSSQVSIVGDVRAPTRIDINPAGDKIIDVIARAGGPTYPGYETYVTLERQRKKSTVNFEDMISDTRENVYVHPGDIVYVSREQARFVAFGATNTNIQGRSNFVDFEARHLTLAEGLAKVGGIDDSRADARKVFLYRFVDRPKLENANFDLTKFSPEQEKIPVVFQLDFSNPTAYFAAQNFFLSNNDLVYVDNSGVYDATKFLTFVTQSASTVSTVSTSVTNTKNAVDALKN